MSEREEFERSFPVPHGIQWVSDEQGYRITSDDDYWFDSEGQAHFRGYLGQWLGWQAARAEMASEAKLPHAGLEVMGDIQINEGGDLHTYYRALLMTFNTNEDIRQAISAEQCTFGFRE